jgi:deazaflavin-dependent oxidoreductase (nitroreductase family)
MARQYHLSRARRLANVLMTALIRLGVKRGSSYLLIVPGRKTGKLHSTPVNLVEDGADRWLVAPYGAVNWVLNTRAAGSVSLRQGRKTETFRAAELPAEESAPVLKQYVQDVPITRPYFTAKPDAPVSDFAAEADRHPVFRLNRIDKGK